MSATLRGISGLVMAIACGVNVYVFAVMFTKATGWRRTAYCAYAASVAIAAGINAVIRLELELQAVPLGFPDWQALVTAPIYLWTGIQGVRAVARISVQGFEWNDYER